MREKSKKQKIDWEKEMADLVNSIENAPTDSVRGFIRSATLSLYGCAVKFDDDIDNEKYQKDFKLDKSDKIWLSIDELMIISEKGIGLYFKSSGISKKKFITWEDLEQATLLDNGDNKFLHVDFSRGSLDIEFGGVILATLKTFYYLPEIIDFINRIASLKGEKNIQVDELAAKVEAMWERIDWGNAAAKEYEEKLLELSTNLDKLIAMRENARFYYLRGIVLYFLRKYTDAFHDFEKAIGLNVSEEGIDMAFFYQAFSETLAQLGNFSRARIFMNTAIAYCNDGKTQREMRERLSAMITEHTASFLSEPYSKRQAVMIVDELPNSPPRNFQCLTFEECHGSEWKWQPGHPQSNVLYIAHPLKKGVYYPIKSFHDFLIQHKYSELMHILQALGAEHVNITFIKGATAINRINSEWSGSIGGEKIAGATLKGGKKSKRSVESNRQQSHSLSFNFQPTRFPYLPKDIYWFEHEPTWKRIADARLNGGITDASVELKYDEDYQVNENTVKNISLEVKAFGMGAAADYLSSVDKSSYKKENILWKFEVKFAPFSSFDRSLPMIETGHSNQIASDFTGAELEYLEDLQDAFSGGIISEDAHRLLERRREKLGIERERANELEKQVLLASMSEAEREYFEDAQLAYSDGAISDSVRKMLGRRRLKLKISEERAEEIEGKIIKKK